ncbi:MAG: hypothetical protein KDA61_03535 [Planctomycetales bacterium]|nr:hypothetical protein [Planctomycetales bacterium]
MAALCCLSGSVHGAVATLGEARALFEAGEYEACLDAAREATSDDGHPEWARLEIASELAIGRYVEALASATLAQDRFPYDLSLRLLRREALLLNNRAADARELLEESLVIVQQQSRRFRDSSALTAVGRCFMLGGADSRQVLKVFYDRAKEANPSNPEPFQAAGDLALAKHDYRVAANEFRAGLRLSPNDPGLHLGLAKALASSDWKAAQTALQAALEANPRHVDSLLYAVDHAVDAEEYSRADALLDQIAKVNPRDARAWAYRAVLAHLRQEPEREEQCRAEALQPWPANPEVDWLIGRKLSEKYRFNEGAAHQRLALEFDPEYLPAQIQLSQDLLRLGEEDEGWSLAQGVAREDQYDVLAHNLGKLEQRLAKFSTLRRDGLTVRMEATEAELYGQDVLDWLVEARDVLADRYRVDLPEQIYVEIFPEQQDFAIRTFGLPGGAGYLGVCFGPVVTAISPAAQGNSPTSWRSVLWHEFCHVVTLTKTHNKMPRWLSEGISVYEERRRDASWGQRMSPEFRELALRDDLAPVSGLSGSFLSPASGEALQFAYFQSSMVVEYLVETFGHEALLDVLDDLAHGEAIDAALGSVAGGMGKLDRDFAAFLRQRAQEMAPTLDFTQPPSPDLASGPENSDAFGRGGMGRGMMGRGMALEDSLEAWFDEHPDNFYALQAAAQRAMAGRRWAEAAQTLEKITGAFGADVDDDGAFAMLAQCHAALGDRESELAALEQLAVRDDAALDACLTLLEDALAKQDWERAAKFADRALGINPLRRAVHEGRAAAATELQDWDVARRAYESQLSLEHADRAEILWRLAQLNDAAGTRDDARRRLLQAIEEAPRRREALALWLQWADDESDAAQRDAPAEPTDQPPANAGEEPVDENVQPVEDASDVDEQMSPSGPAAPSAEDESPSTDETDSETKEAEAVSQ